MTTSITILTHLKLITCIVERGLADTIVKATREAGAPGATVFYGRGMGVRERLGILGIAIDTEKEIIQLIVPQEHAELILDKIFLAGKLSTPGKGFVFVTPIEKAATYIPPRTLKKMKEQNHDLFPV